MKLEIKVSIAAVAVLFVVLILYRQSNILSPVEVRNYQGQKLSSINDIVDNNIKGTQEVNESAYTLAVAGMTNKTYTYQDILDMKSYQKVVTLNCVEGWSATILWKGVLVKDLLSEAGINSSYSTVIFYASDGYTTSLPLDYIVGKDILLAYEMNGVVLPPQKGFPLQLVAESKYGYKWIKWVTKIELSDNSSYKGYWESRGYSNEGDIL
jgi:DMSO/TMAO reductase YedYZ molybdopterin-dependent catalytic subunit